MTTSTKIAVIIPIFKHSVLLSEAINSALGQTEEIETSIVLVDDGCPMQETELVSRAFCLAAERVYYLRKHNGGLSSARNHGIEFVLSYLPEIELIYFLDADNRLSPGALRGASSFLQKSGADWVYPNIDKFGIAWSGNFTAPYSKLVHTLAENICEAGSLISRHIVETGIRFDENMKEGYEDWDFWLQCLDAGFNGINFPYFGFEYRQRAESMVRDSKRAHDSIRAYMKKKHAKLFRADALLNLEHSEAPRYLCINASTFSVLQFTDPRYAGKGGPFSDFVSQYWKSHVEPDTFRIPPFFSWLEEADANVLVQAGMANTVYLAAERLAESHHFVRITFQETDRTYGILEETTKPAAIGSTLPTRGWFCRTDLLRACVSDSSDDWVNSLDSAEPQPSVANLIVSLPAHRMKGVLLHNRTTTIFFHTLARLKEAGSRVQKARWNWRSVCLPDMSNSHLLLRAHLNAAPISNRLKPSHGFDIGIVLPVATFGGVEKVAYNIAACLRRSGLRLHLFILGGVSYEEFNDFKSVFETINFIGGQFPFWVGGHRYMGHDFALGGEAGAHSQRVLGLLFGLDVILASHVGPLNSSLGEVRRAGTKVVGHFHVVDQSRRGRDVGHPYLAMAFEHAYDLMLTCSERLKDFMHGLGVPQEKLIHIPNAPSFSPKAPLSWSAISERRAVSPNELRVLFMGRLDRQKGIERLFFAARELRKMGRPIRWRLFGGRVIEENSSSSWEERLRSLEIDVEPPIFDTAGISDALFRSDVLLLPSRWEGAPLTILEAQQHGCIPMATNVGAVSELITDDVDGVLLPEAGEGKIVATIVAELCDLLENPARRQRLSKASVERLSGGAWQKSCVPLFDALKTWGVTTERIAQPPMRTRIMIHARARLPLCLVVGLLLGLSAAPVSALELGVNVVNPDHLTRAQQDRVLQQLSDAKVAVIRVPLNDGTIDFIARAAHLGIKTDAILPVAFKSGSPARAVVADSPGSWAVHGLTQADADASKAAFVRLLKRLDDQAVTLDAMELGNEINWTAFNGDFPVPGKGVVFGSADLKSDPEARGVAAGFDRYVSVLQALREARSTTTSNRMTPILSAGLSNPGAPGPRPGSKLDAISIDAALTALRQRGMDRFVDGYGVHIYPDRQETENQMVGDLDKALDECGAATKPCWITEWGIEQTAVGCTVDDGPRMEAVKRFQHASSQFVKAGRLDAMIYYSWAGDPLGSKHSSKTSDATVCGALTDSGRSAIMGH